MTESTVFVSDTASVRSLESTSPVEPEPQAETSQPTPKNKTVAIIGAGLVGCLAALAFERKGYKVRVYEGRPDARTPEQRKIF